jgi:molecular chaperone GrpE
MPGPGHPGHFPKPPGWVDQPGGGSGASRSPGPNDRPAGGASQGPPPAPSGPTASAPPSDSSPAGEAGTGRGGAGKASRAQEAAARVAEMLQEREEQDGEAVEEAAEAVEHDIGALAAAEAQRDEYLDSLRRLQADFENYKKRIQRQHADLQERAAEKLVENLLPVLDNFDLALAHADVDAGLDPVYRSLLGTLAAAGLERLDPAGQPFDPNEHDAVQHEPGDAAEPEVIEVLRAGYRWKGRVLRPAMVKVKG